MSKFLHTDDDNNEYAKATAILPVFSENSRAKNHLIIQIHLLLEDSVISLENFTH